MSDVGDLFATFLLRCRKQISTALLIRFPEKGDCVPHHAVLIAPGLRTSVIVMVLPYRGRPPPLTIFREAGELF